MFETTPHPDRAPIMRSGQRLTYADLQEEAQEAVRLSGKTQADVAELLGVAPGSLSKALNSEGSRYASLQRRVIEELTDYRLEEEPFVFRAVRKEQ